MAEITQIVLLPSLEAATAAEPLFPASFCVYSNGKLAPQCLDYDDAVVIGPDAAWREETCTQLAKLEYSRIRFADGDISQIEGDPLEWVRSRIKPYSAPQVAIPSGEGKVADNEDSTDGYPFPSPDTPAAAEPAQEGSGRDWSDANLTLDHDEDERAEIALHSIRMASARKSQAHHDEQEEPGAWPTPADFWGLANLPEFFPDALPPAIAPYVMDQASRAGLDPAQVALNCYVVCSSLIRTGIDLQMQPDMGDDGRVWRERPILWGAVVGNPSTGKGPAMDIALLQAQKIELRLRKQDQAAWDKYDDDVKIHDKQMQAYIADAAKNGHSQRPLAPEKPPRNRLFIDDATKEVVAKIITENPRGKVTVLKDELASWFGSFGAYGATGAEKDRGDWLSFYESKHKWIDRAMEGRSYDVESWGGCILGGIQPEVMAKQAQKLGADGMLQRFMIITAAPKQQVKTRAADSVAVADWNRIQENLSSMNSTGGSVKLSPDAAEFMDECADWIAKAMQSGIAPSLQACLGKWEGLFGRLAITSHCIGAAAAGMPFPPALVTLETCEQVWRWMRGLLWPHATHFYLGLGEQGEEIRFVKSFAEYVLARDLGQVITVELGRNWSTYRRQFKTIQQRREFWANVVQAGWARPLGLVGRNEGISSRYEINPHALDGRYADAAEKAKSAAEHYRQIMHPAFLAAQTREPGEEG